MILYKLKLHDWMHNNIIISVIIGIVQNSIDLTTRYRYLHLQCIIIFMLTRPIVRDGFAVALSMATTPKCTEFRWLKFYISNITLGIIYLDHACVFYWSDGKAAQPIPNRLGTYV